MKSLRPVLSRSLIALLLAAGATAAVAEVPTATLEQADALIKAGKADQAYLLLDPLEIEGAGDLVFDYLLGTAALESGRPGRATFIYERILAANPGYVGVRADMGRAYYAQGDYARAKVEFETVISTPNIPPDLRAMVEKYNELAEGRAKGKRGSFVGYVEAGYGYDTNVNSATRSGSVFLPAFNQPLTLLPPDKKSGDHYWALSFGGEYSYQLTDQWGVFAGGDLRGRTYRDYASVDSRGADVRTGLTYAGGRWLLKTGLTAGTFTQNDAHVRSTTGWLADWRYALTDKTQLTMNASFSRADYWQPTQSTAESDTTTLSAGFFTAVGKSSAVSLTMNVGLDDATRARADGNAQFWGPRLFALTNFNDRLGGFVTTGVSLSTYDRENPLFFRTRRETLYDAAVGVSYSLMKGLAIRPQLTYLKNESNVELYKYDKTDLSVNLRYDF